MKLSKHQKEIIRHIYKGDIYDILSYIKFFNLGKTIKFDKTDVDKSFDSDELPKKYYCPKNLHHTFVNMIPESTFNELLLNEEVDSEKYTEHNITLSYNSGIKHESWNGQEFTFNFYNGVYVVNSFNVVLDFLIIWQYLLSEMLILEVSSDFTADLLGLFYEKCSNTVNQNLSLEDRIKEIDFQNLTYDDQNYLKEYNYTLSHEHCCICQEYLGKRIYPSAKLGIYIKKNFTTYEENTQNRALFVAWLAIFVSIALTFAPYFHQEDTSNIEAISQDIKEPKDIINNTETSNYLPAKLDNIIEKIDVLINTLSTRSTDTESSEATSEQQK